LHEKFGFNNINIDLMLALPTQTIENLIENLNRIISLNPEHISLYSLILEENTILEKEVRDGKYILPSDELERRMYHETKKVLELNGYNHYEISNFSKIGFESKHNMNCWEQNEYLGFGLASHSYFGGVRFSNTIDINEYLIKDSKYCIEINEFQNEEDMLKEYMMLGFRKINGINISKFKQKFGINPLFYFRREISKLEKQGLVEVDLDNIVLTSKGLDLANKVFECFV